jgi:glutamyl-tRNA reductase
VKVLLVGASHRTAPLGLRERLAVPDPVPALRKLVASQEVEEAVILSTCNRVEVVATTRSLDAARLRIRSFLRRELADEDLGPELDGCLYEHVDADAMRHVLRVACSLDSMVLGEPQILGQAKQAYRGAVEARAAGPVLGRLFQQAFATAKRVRAETRVAERPLSVARVAVDLARRIFEELADKRALLLGGGEMVEAALDSLRGAGLARIAVANRTPERAAELAARCGATAHGLDEVPRLLGGADLLLACMATPVPLLGADAVAAALRSRRGRPLFVIDLGVPRNVDRAVDRLDDVYLYDVDDLGAVAEENAAARQQERARAEAIVEEEMLRFDAWLAALRAVPTIRHLRERAERIRAAELERVTGRLPLGEAEREAVEYLSRSLVNKLLHAPMTQLRRAAEREEGGATLEVARLLFELDTDPDADPDPDAEPTDRA